MSAARDVRQFVHDMLVNARRAQSIVVGLSSVEALYEVDWRTQYALLRALEIIGEAARYVPQEVRQLAPEIPWRDVVGMRNLLIHRYHGVDWEIIWETVHGALPALMESLERLLTRLEE